VCVGSGDLMKFIAWFSLFWSLPLFALSAELALTVPLETRDLTVPGIRDGRKVWLEMIDGAKSTLDIEQFYITDKKGEALEGVLDAIRRAAHRGVRVRLLTDAKFFKTYPDTILELGSRKNIESRVIDLGPINGVQHSKFFIVDVEDSISGSHNFDWRALTHIHEISLRVKDKAAGQKMERLFEADWNRGVKVGKNTVSTDSLVVGPDVEPDHMMIVASPGSMNPAGIRETLPALDKLFHSAKKTIRIQVMTYGIKDAFGDGTDWKHLQDLMTDAGARGVQVQFLVDDNNLKYSKDDLVFLNRSKNVEVKTVLIPQHSSGPIDYARLIHSKYVTIDGQHNWIGSENWTKGYFMSARNVGFIFQSPQIAKQLEEVFAKLWDSGYASFVH
jgi:phosphatidylserine/phosphatidylglycerophosphate/cardiolipin synthase-like enzyme